MGRDKALLDFGGRPLIRLLAERLESVTDEILISSPETSGYAFLDLPVIADVHAGQGPLAGLHSAFLHTSRSMVLLLACDLPRVKPALLKRLLACADGYAAVVPKTDDGRIHPLCAVYRRACMPVAARNLSLGLNKMTGILHHPDLPVKWLSPLEGRFVPSDLFNLNTPKDLEDFNKSL